MVPNIEYDFILLLGYSILYKDYNLTRFNHQKKHYPGVLVAGHGLSCADMVLPRVLKAPESRVIFGEGFLRLL